MNRTIIIALGILLLVAAIIFIGYDFYFSNSLPETNPYEYNIDAFKTVDSTQVAWTEIQQIVPDSDSIKSLAVDQQDNIYIGGHKLLFIYSKEGHLKNSFETGGLVRALHVDTQGKIYMAMEDHVEIWNRSGRKLESWEAINPNSVLTSIATTDSLVFLADAGNRIVYEYSKQGILKKMIGEKDPEKGIQGFFIPNPYFDLLMGRDGELWVVNPGLHQLEAYNMQGILISSWQKTSMQLDGFCGCCNPTNIAMLANGEFVTSEKAIERVKIHQPDGEFKEVVATPDDFEEGTVGLDLAVDNHDRILVLDPARNQIRIFVRNK